MMPFLFTNAYQPRFSCNIKITIFVEPIIFNLIIFKLIIYQLFFIYISASLIYIIRLRNNAFVNKYVTWDNNTDKNR